MLHRFSKLVAGCTVLLILAGSFVTSTDSGLSVPDWPTTYGWNMFTFPPSKWVGGIFYEHGHRLIASTVGFLTIILAAWLWFADSRRWLRWFGVAALGAVIAQGVLGGLTVLFFLPAAVSTAHAGLAEIFFCMTVAIALFTGPGWIAGYGDSAHSATGVDDSALRRLATLTTIVIYVQILIGATMRHLGAGLAIPDFPLAFGHLVPPTWSTQIAVHFTHRVVALIVIAGILANAGWIRARYRGRPELVRPSTWLILAVLVQGTLGALVVLTAKQPVVNTLHVATGAIVLATSLIVTLRAFRVRFPLPARMS
jgi:cytochrome c oxidase assembly protein subunit 15